MIGRNAKEILDVCSRLYLHNFVANHDGNVSVKLQDDRFLITPTAESKGDISDDMLITVDSSGKVISGRYKPFSEFKIHIAAYHYRSDILSVVHAHPPYAFARSCSGKNLSTAPFPEAIVSLGIEIPLTEFAIPGSKKSAEAIFEGLKKSDSLLLANNGVLAVGKTPLQAYYRLELVEHIAKMTHIGADQLRKIPDVAIEELLKKRASAGIGPSKTTEDQTENIIQEVIRKIRQSDHMPR